MSGTKVELDYEEVVALRCILTRERAQVEECLDRALARLSHSINFWREELATVDSLLEKIN